MSTHQSRTSTLAALAAFAVLAAGCTVGSDDKPQPTGSSSGAQPMSASQTGGAGTYLSIEPGTPSGGTELGRTKTGPEGEYFVLTGLRRLGKDRVVVEGRARGSDRAGGWGFFNEPGYGGRSYGFGGDFAGVSLSRKGDPAVYLPVRNADRSCLCSGFPANHTMSEELGVYVVVSAPEADDGYTLTVNKLGSISGLTVR